MSASSAAPAFSRSAAGSDHELVRPPLATRVNTSAFTVELISGSRAARRDRATRQRSAQLLKLCVQLVELALLLSCLEERSRIDAVR